MGKKSGARSQTRPDTGSRSRNPQDPVGEAARIDQAAQVTPGTPAFKAVRANRSVLLSAESDESPSSDQE
jgi:hypothetical protein